MTDVERGQRGRIAALARAHRQRGEIDREIALRVGHDPARATSGEGSARAASAPSSAAFHSAGVAFQGMREVRGRPARRSGKAPSSEATIAASATIATDKVYE